MNAIANRRAAGPTGGASASNMRLSVASHPRDVEAEWRTLESTAVGHVFQTFDWMESWIDNVGAARGTRATIVIGRDAEGTPEFLLPLGVRRARGVRVLEWLGDEHADYHGGLFAPGFLARIGDDEMAFRALLEAVIAAVGEVDLIHMIRQPATLGGRRNPFLALSSFHNASAAHATALGTDWEGYYKAKRGSGWRRTDRGKLRKLNELGQVSVVSGEDPDTRRRILQTLFEQKREGLARMGVADMFAADGARAFYEALADRHYPDGPSHVCALRCGEEIVACNFSLVRGDTYYYVLHSYDLGRFVEFSPGRALMYEIMQWAIACGYSHFDFTIGDEAYKDSWCEERLELYDSVAPCTLPGGMAAASYRMSQALKRTIKNDPRLWAAARYVRARVGRGG